VRCSRGLFKKKKGAGSHTLSYKIKEIKRYPDCKRDVEYLRGWASMAVYAHKRLT